MKKVSVIMSVFNETEEYLRAAITSILTQTYSNIEFIIILDNPQNTELKNFIDSFAKQDARIIFHINSENVGLAMSLNTALSLATGEYIARMDADDISFSERIEKQVIYLDEHSECSVVSSGRQNINENGKYMNTSDIITDNQKALKRIIKWGSPFVHPSIMVRAEIYRAMNGYRNLPNAEDYDLFWRLLESNYKIHVLGERLLFYRIRQDGNTRLNYAKQYRCCQYIRYLHKNNNNDIINVDVMNSYWKKIKLYSQDDMEQFNLGFAKVYVGLDRIKGKQLAVGGKDFIKGFCQHPEVFHCFVYAFFYKLVVRKYQVYGDVKQHDR